jgi:ADP-ribosylglycohydrolase
MTPLTRALVSLDGLSIGDAFGQCFFQPENAWPERLRERELPSSPWRFTDDTVMSLSVVAVLRQHDRVDQGSLARSFAERYEYDRAYGPSMHRLLARIRDGEPWQEVAADAFEGQGSYGNGGAMRAAPLGAFFADDLDLAAEQAARSAEVTHSHQEGIAGAVAVALAAAQACRCRVVGARLPHAEFIQSVVDRLPASEVRSKLVKARTMERVNSLQFPVAVLGNGTQMAAQDTVPYALWCCAQSLDDYAGALWMAVAGGGDRDTLCAIVGGVVASYVGAQGIPHEWRARAEPLPAWHTASPPGSVRGE